MSIVAYSDLKDLVDAENNKFIPLKPGLRLDEDFIIIPKEAWHLLVQWYPNAENGPAIIRTAHDTSPEDAVQSNLQFELYPPIFTIQKLANESQGRGLDTIRDVELLAAQMVASRSDGYQGFLRRAKSASGIDPKSKVAVWKVVETLKTTDGRAGIPTPASSRANSPAPVMTATVSAPKLIIDCKTFETMAEGTQKELLDIKDETSNDKYNGHLTVGAVGFLETQTLVLEELLKEGSVASRIQKNSAMSSPRSSPTKTAPSTTLGVGRFNQSASNNRRSPTQGIMTRGRSNKTAKKKGTVGLANLGNTCYINSALQCIRGVEELTLYFLRKYPILSSISCKLIHSMQNKNTKTNSILTILWVTAG